jgi:nitrogen fixation protein NifU and related proteins
MSQSNALYQQVILDHNRNPRNYREMPQATHHCEGHNPLCGDHITVFAQVNSDQQINDLSFQGNGCAICKASASLMTTSLKGKTLTEAKELFQEFHGMVTGTFETETTAHHLGKLTLFQGVREYSSRIKCASLAWHALMGAFESQGSATTEV